LERVFGDEPTWVGTMSVEPFEFVVEDGDHEGLTQRIARGTGARRDFKAQG
jgi:hypothetical protein